MDAEEYKRLIEEGDVLDHTTLNITLKEMAARKEVELVKGIEWILKHNKIEKPPADLKPFDNRTNYYKVDLVSEDIDRIIEIFLELEVGALGEDGANTPTASFYASLVDKWDGLD